MKPYKILPLSYPIPRRKRYRRKLKPPRVPLYFFKNSHPVKKMKFVYGDDDMPSGSTPTGLPDWWGTTAPAEDNSSQDP